MASVSTTANPVTQLNNSSWSQHTTGKPLWDRQTIQKTEWQSEQLVTWQHWFMAPLSFSVDARLESIVDIVGYAFSVDQSWYSDTFCNAILTPERGELIQEEGRAIKERRGSVEKGGWLLAKNKEEIREKKRETGSNREKRAKKRRKKERTKPKGESESYPEARRCNLEPVWGPNNF